MDLVNEFVVPRPIDRTWQVLTDVELIAPCLPGAQLTEVEGDVYRGLVKVKVGPILAKFAGQAKFVELDEANHRAVLDARGKESTGKGLASAMVTAQLREQGDSTVVEVTTALTISGKLAQFGRGALADVSAKLLGQFAERLEELVLSQEAEAAQPEPGQPEQAAPAEQVQPAGPAGPAGPAEPVAQTPATDTAPVEKAAPAETTPAAAPAAASTGGVRVINSPEAEPVNLLGSAGAPILKRVVPLLLVLVVVVVVLVLALR